MKKIISYIEKKIFNESRTKNVKNKMHSYLKNKVIQEINNFLIKEFNTDDLDYDIPDLRAFSKCYTMAFFTNSLVMHKERLYQIDSIVVSTSNSNFKDLKVNSDIDNSVSLDFVFGISAIQIESDFKFEAFMELIETARELEEDRRYLAHKYLYNPGNIITSKRKLFF